jgi:hypothetical protein
VTRAFVDPNCVIAGNPAKVVRRGVQWIRNRTYIEDGSKFALSHDAFHAEFAPVAERQATRTDDEGLRNSEPPRAAP